MMIVSRVSGICCECKSVFKDGYEITLNKKVFNKIKMCCCCASTLYSKFASEFVPKSPQNINNKKHKKV